MKQGFFISFGVRATLRFLVSIKKFGQYKKFPSEKFVTKKRTFRKTFRSTQKFLELQCLLDDFRITNVYQCFFTLNILLDAHLLRINIVTMCKKDDSPSRQGSRFFIVSKGVGLSVDI